MKKDVLEQNVETLIETGGEPPRIGDGARTRIRADLVHTFAVAQVPRSRARPIALGLVAAAAAVVILGLVVGPRPRPLTRVDHALADGSTYLADTGGKVTVLGPRHVRVEGTALLDVAPGKGTFVVETPHGRIEVLGTRFLVEGDAARTLTAVIRGEVRLASNLGSVILHAGEQGIAEPGHPPVRSPAPRLSHLASWAREMRAKQEKTTSVHHGSLFARDPGIRSHPPWGNEYPLPLEQLTVDVTVEDQVARVALDQTFHNNANEELEGVYRFAIPPDAALQRLAMYVDGKLEESAVVERMQARRIYEELVYRRVDPALLEWAGTGRLDLRVYPLHANQDKRLMLAYTQSLPRLYDDWTLTVPLPEVDQPVGSLDVAVRVKGCANCELSSTSQQVTVERTGDDAIVHVHQTGAKDLDSFVLHARDPRKTATVATHTTGDERYLLVRAPADLGSKPREYKPRTWIVLDDVSASRHPDELRAQADVIDALAKELDENDKLAVIAFDVEARQKLAPTRVLDVDRRALRESLRGEGGVGATDFGAALDAALKLGGDDTTIVYLGDGVITSGSRHLDELRAKLAGKAHFIGVGIGDGADTQTLDALAGATGGYATTIDLADDLGWRTFDLVAALHTARVTGLEARLVDATGTTVPATAYLRSPQLADGEDIELVARLAGAGAPAALELTGSLDGAPWSKRIELSASPHDGGYLPRLWAQRHIAARLLAKHEPAPPCAGEPCATEDQRRETRDEQIRREVVALGKKYFLLSRHTSLLVLENDAMYAQYGVTKGAGDTWAPYAMPDHIDVKTAQQPAIPDDAEIVRAPLQVFYNYNQGWQGNRMNEQQEILDGHLGFDRDRWAGDVVTRGPVAGQGFGRRGGDISTLTLERKGFREHEDSVSFSGSTSTDNTYIVDGVAQRGVLADLESVRGAFDLPTAATEVGGARYWHASAGYGPLSPIHFTYPTDVAFDDVTAFVPALVADRFDQLRAVLGRASDHTIDEAARALLLRARAALPAGVYHWGSFEIAVDAQHRLGWRRTTEAGLGEAAAYDGTTWTRRYGELDLDVTRAVATDDVALAMATLPIWIADPAHYAKYFDVTAKGHDVTLSRAGTQQYVLAFDDQAHLVRVADADGATIIRVTWTAGVPSAARSFGEDLAVGFAPQPIADAPAWGLAGVAPGVVPGVVIDLPLHAHPTTTAPEGSAAWRATQRQRIAAAAATGDRTTAFSAYEALRTHGGVELGDLVLASGGIATASTDAQQTAALATLSTTALARYLAASRAYGKSPSPEKLVPFVAGGLVGNLWALRAASAELQAGHGKAAVDRLAAITGSQLRMEGAAALASRDVKPEDITRAWALLETSPLVNIARAQAAYALHQRGQTDAATDVITHMVDNLDLHAPPAELAQYLPGIFQQSRRGAAGWAIVWAKWRDEVLAGGSLDHVYSIAPVAAQTPDDLQRVLRRAAELTAGDPVATLDVAQLAFHYRQDGVAQTLLAELMKVSPSREVYQTAGQLALAQGRASDALAMLEAAQDAPGNDAVPAETVRAELAQLIGVAREVALAAQGPARQAAVAKALHWGDRWRAIDPDNPAIDTQLGDLLLAVGDTAGAWRQLSGTIERDPWSGAGYMNVADAFEHQGKADQALAFWQQAIVIDQTNPTPRLRKAQALIALGRTAEGDELLRDIATHKWHDMWSGVVYQAKDLLARGASRNGRDR